MKWNKGSKFIEVTELPGYKHKVLFVGKSNHCWKVGSFISDICAEEFESYLNEFLGQGEESGGIDTLEQY